MDVFELCKKYYPILWNKDRIYNLYKTNKITEEQYNEIIKEDK